MEVMHASFVKIEIAFHYAINVKDTNVISDSRDFTSSSFGSPYPVTIQYLCHRNMNMVYNTDALPSIITVANLSAVQYPITVTRTPSDSRCWDSSSKFQVVKVDAGASDTLATIDNNNEL